MSQPGGMTGQRRSFLVSSLSVFGYALSLGAVASLSGCSDDKSAGKIENAVDPTKTPDGMDSMKAYQDQMKKRGGPATKR